jgi:hypothetical protein
VHSAKRQSIEEHSDIALRHLRLAIKQKGPSGMKPFGPLDYQSLLPA